MFLNHICGSLLLWKGIYLYSKRLILTLTVWLVFLVSMVAGFCLREHETTGHGDNNDSIWLLWLQVDCTLSLKRQLENTRKPHTDKHERGNDKNERKRKEKKGCLIMAAGPQLVHKNPDVTAPGYGSSSILWIINKFSFMRVAWIVDQASLSPRMINSSVTILLAKKKKKVFTVKVSLSFFYIIYIDIL